MFSYDPTLPDDVSRMRFALGDTLVEEPEKTAYLTDEEICAALKGRSFKRAQLALVETLIARFSYEVDSKVHDAEWKMSQRWQAWQELRKQLKTELMQEEMGGAAALRANFSPPVFRKGLHDVFQTW